ncbi:hypothetical protein J6A31_01290 [bacterium]|nr:hypothetical protein [bacterium]
MLSVNFDVERQVKCHYVIHKFSAKAAASIAIKIWKKKLILIKPWIVLENVEGIKPLLIEMLIELGKVYGLDVSKNRAKAKVNFYLLKQAPKFIAGGLVTIMGISEVANSTLAGLLTERLGWEFVKELVVETVSDSENIVSKKENAIEKTIMNSLGIDIPYDKRIKCHYVIHGAVSAVSGTRLVAVPFAGKYSVEAIQVGMIVSLAKIFDVSMNLDLAQEYLAVTANKKKWEVIIKEALSTLPIGKVTNATIDAILTERMGWQVAQYFYDKSLNK